jgi:hypothetical protein
MSREAYSKCVVVLLVACVEEISLEKACLEDHWLEEACLEARHIFL